MLKVFNTGCCLRPSLIILTVLDPSNFLQVFDGHLSLSTHPHSFNKNLVSCCSENEAGDLSPVLYSLVRMLVMEGDCCQNETN